VGHSILVAAWHVVRNGAAYRDLGRGYFDRLNRERLNPHHTRRLAELGVAIAVAPVPIPAELSGDPLSMPSSPSAPYLGRNLFQDVSHCRYSLESEVPVRG